MRPVACRVPPEVSPRNGTIAAVDAGPVNDRLRLIFTCCHPALDMPARVALTLRTLGGLTTTEIARAFLVSESSTPWLLPCANAAT